MRLSALSAIALIGLTILPRVGLAQGTVDAAAAAGDDGARQSEEIVVIGVAPSHVLSVDHREVEATHAVTVTDALDRNLGSVFLSDTQGNPYQLDLYFRGFDASPVLGTPQGLAVYQNGTRINERFGDTVLWDLTPAFAIQTVSVVPGSDPLLGRNALGGAVAIEMKTGFTSPGESVDLAGGSYGRARLISQAGIALDDTKAVYVGLMALHDGGWRQYSPNDLLQGYADLSGRFDWGNAGISLTLAGDTLNGNAAVPVQDFRAAAFAISDLARDRLAFLQAHADGQLTDAASLTGRLYFRSTQVKSFNGAASGFAPCDAPAGQLCDGDGNPLTTPGGAPISSTVASSGIVPVESVDTNALGASAELTLSGNLLSLDHAARIGFNADYAHTGFNSVNYLGTLVYLPGGGGTNTISNGVQIGGPDYNIGIGSLNIDGGFYAEDTVNLTPALTARLATRVDLDRIALSDRLGLGSTLTGEHGYAAINPSFGLTWRLDDGTNLFASFGQSSRTPTAAELSCADPTQPCRFPLSFISDPSLKEVTARTFEAGAKGSQSLDGVTLHWSADAYETRNQNDIQFVSSGALVGSGFFANVGATRRLGVEAVLDGAWRDLDFRLSYSYVEATFRSALALQSPNNPSADGNGNIFVRPGDRIPGVPLHMLKARIGWQPTEALHIRLDGSYSSSRFLGGDQSNSQPPLLSFFVADADIDYEIYPHVSLYFEGENLFDRHYATYGLFGDASGNGAFPQFTNNRFTVPAAPFEMWGGVRVEL
jgi:outer membrane receptor protein involved in Fe transport